MASIRFLVDQPLRMFLAPQHRGGDFTADLDGTSSLGHLVQSIGVPLTEVGALLVARVVVAASHQPQRGDLVRVRPAPRPQHWAGPLTLVLDVHLGSLARRLRLLGLDTRYATDADDDELVRIALPRPACW